MSGLVKQDINFMEYALWIQDETIANKSESGFIWYDRDGYTYRTGYKPPTKADFIFLLYFLMQSQQNGWKEEVTFTKYETIKNCGVTPSSFQYERIEDSLKRWSMVKLEFKGVFYDGEKYQTLVFGVIDEYSIKEDSKKIKINFSPKWLQRIKESNYFKYINFSQIKTLRSPLVIRLYEILIKSFQNRSNWEIDAMKLAQKIPMNEKYPADVIPKIKAVINRINKHTTLKVKLTIRRPQRGKAILVFEKLIDEETKKLPPTSGLPEDNNFKSLVALIPKAHQDKKTILETIANAYKKHGFDYTARNIRYTNRNCKGN